METAERCVSTLADEYVLYAALTPALAPALDCFLSPFRHRQLMLAHVSPVMELSKETQNTLRYAEQAEKIVNRQEINTWKDDIDMDKLAVLEHRVQDLESVVDDYELQRSATDSQVASYKSAMEHAREEAHLLKAELQDMRRDNQDLSNRIVELEALVDEVCSVYCLLVFISGS